MPVIFLPRLLTPVALEEYSRQGRQREVKRIQPAVEMDGRCLKTTQIAVTAAAIFLGVSIKDLTPGSPARNTHSIVEAWNRGEVADDEQNILRRTGFANKAEDAAL